MTAVEWHDSSDPAAMLGYLRSSYTGIYHGASERKLRLVACAVARLMENRSPHPERTAVIEACEQIADGKESQWGFGVEGLAGACKSIEAVWGWTWCCTANRVDVGLRETLIQMRGNAGNFYRQEEVADVLRDIVGDPWTDLPLLRYECPICKDDSQFRASGMCRTCYGRGEVLSEWLTPTVLDLANAAYLERDQQGRLDPVRLVILADALEETGCEDDSILFHLRGEFGCNLCEGAGYAYVPEGSLRRMKCGKCNGEGMIPRPPHYRGCHVLDRIREVPK